jgi:hypothetical protein
MQERVRARDAAFIEDLTPFLVADYEYLRYTNERGIKDVFISGERAQAHLVYKDAVLAHPTERLEEVAAFETVITAYSDEVVRRAYNAKLAKTRIKYQLLLAAMQQDDRGVHAASVRMYGAPQEDIFFYTLRGLRDDIDRVASVYDTYPIVHEALALLREATRTVPMRPTSFESIVLPVLHVQDLSAACTAEEIQALFTQAFVEHDIQGWHAVIDAPGERVTFNTNQEYRTVFIPSDEDLAMRKHPLTKRRVDAIIAHEVGTHIVRRENGAKSPLALLGVGLAGYLRAEEGIATYVEQIRLGTSDFSGGLGYLAVSWAMGLDGTPRTFRMLYDLLVPYFIVSALRRAILHHETPDVHFVCDLAKRQAWARCVRTFRGTSGDTPGACYTKDIVYREGNIAIWELLQKDPTWVKHFSLGKYDPTDPEHVAILKDVEVLG